MALALSERWQTWWRARARRRDLAAEPGAALFAGVRLRLTLWYIGVLAAVLVIAGTVLYLGVRQTLLHTVDQTLAAAARHSLDPRQGGGGPFGGPGGGGTGGPIGCPLRGLPGGGRAILVACYAPDGSLVGESDSALGVTDFTGGTIVAEATQHGSAYDTIDGGSDTGPVRRYAVSLPRTDPTRPVSVIVVGTSIRGEMDTLRTLLVALLVTGILALLIAALGGLFLAARALAPARLAFHRQQAFIADAAHELRTPLTLLRADADVLLRSRNRLPEEDAALVADIAAEAAHMSMLTTTMLDMARLDAGRTHLERDVVDLVAVVRELVQRTDAYARAAGVTLDYGHSGNVLTLGDPTLLTQALLILVDNAIKYNRAGGRVTVRADRIGARAEIAVADTGIGIATDDLRHLGERFYRVDKARSRETGGAGLGIAIARTIAAMHGGTLTYTSTPGEGTTATLSLPAA